MLSKTKTIEAVQTMGDLFPDAHCELNHRNAFELLIATILSAQATDVGVNKVTPKLFERFPTPAHLAAANEESVIECIQSLGLYRSKAKNIRLCAQQLMERFNGEVPKTREELVSLAGVGRKTANVVMSVAFNIPAFAVDTHVERISKRLQICRQKDTVLEVEETLCRKIPKELWSRAHHWMIFFGRYHCIARKPKCHECPLLEMCAFGKREV
ncbi:endonuclease III [uncultured Granulicatella sp.]|uniref:endonuclease III n=1 Tax=uncultured Granulicatella sp. TaxID=316089 RepID=UPI0028DC288B|nr:endonuclease III [uncultured Granulicatella sp.]